MKEKVKARNIIALLIIIILSLIIIASSVYFTAFGSFIKMRSEPMQVFGIGLYPNTNADGEPVSYSAVLYNSNLSVARGNAVAYLNPESKARCKLNTAYYYEKTDQGFTLYDDEEGEYFDISTENLRGRAVSNIPYLGAILSFASSLTGIIVFGAFGLIVLILLIVYIVTFAKRFTRKKTDDGLKEEIDDVTLTERKIKAEQLSNSDAMPEEDQDLDKTAQEVSDSEAQSGDEGDVPMLVDIKARQNTVYITAKGSVEKITKLEKAVKMLKDKKGFDVTVEPVDAPQAGTLIICEKDKLAVIAAIIKKIDA